jgi:hypothetical protein
MRFTLFMTFALISVVANASAAAAAPRFDGEARLIAPNQRSADGRFWLIGALQPAAAIATPEKPPVPSTFPVAAMPSQPHGERFSIGASLQLRAKAVNAATCTLDIFANGFESAVSRRFL